MSALYWKFCKVCRRDIDWHKVERTTAAAKLFGWVLYGICVCGMEAVDAWDPNYRRRWRKARKQAQEKVKSAPVTRGNSRKKEAGKP